MVEVIESITSTVTTAVINLPSSNALKGPKRESTSNTHIEESIFNIQDLIHWQIVRILEWASPTIVATVLKQPVMA